MGCKKATINNEYLQIFFDTFYTHEKAGYRGYKSVYTAEDVTHGNKGFWDEICFRTFGAD